MSDLIERLHDVAAVSRNHDGETEALIDAADRIEELEAEAKEQAISMGHLALQVEKLRAAWALGRELAATPDGLDFKYKTLDEALAAQETDDE